jgi:hypothetical protein
MDQTSIGGANETRLFLCRGGAAGDQRIDAASAARCPVLAGRQPDSFMAKQPVVSVDS